MLTSFSHSGLNSFRTCPRQFKFNFIDRVRIKSISAAKQLGTSVHNQLQLLYRLKSDGKEYSLDDMLKAYDHEWETSDKENIVVAVEQMTVDDYIASGRRMLQDYYEANQPFDHGRILGVERHLNFQLPGSSFQFRGQIDRLIRKPDGTIEICDYKTNRNLPNGVKDPSFSRQMALYHIAVKELFPDFDDIEVCQYFLKHGEVIRYKFSEEELEQFSEEFRLAALDIVHAQRLDDFRTKEGGLCEYCDYFKLCPAKRHQLMLKDETDTPTDAETAEKLAGKYLRLDLESKLLAAELDALKEQLIGAAETLAVDKIVSDEGEVVIKRWDEEKLPTKTGDPKAFSQLLYQVKQWGLEECLTLDTRVLLKEFYLRNKLSKEQMAALKEMLEVKRYSRVSPRRPKDK